MEVKMIGHSPSLHKYFEVIWQKLVHAHSWAIWQNSNNVNSEKLYTFTELNISNSQITLSRRLCVMEMRALSYSWILLWLRFKELKVTLESVYHLNNKKHNSGFLSFCQCSPSFRMISYLKGITYVGLWNSVYQSNISNTYMSLMPS